MILISQPGREGIRCSEFEFWMICGEGSSSGICVESKSETRCVVVRYFNSHKLEFEFE